MKPKIQTAEIRIHFENLNSFEIRQCYWALDVKLSFIKLIIILQRGFDSIVANCFHFAFHHLQTEAHGGGGRRRQSWDFENQKPFFMHRKGPYTAQTGNKNNLENPEFNSGHGPLESLNDRRLIHDQR